MQLIDLKTKHTNFYCPVTGAPIAIENKGIFDDARSLMGYWHHELLDEPVINNKEFEKAWDTFLASCDDEDGTELDPCTDINEVLNTCFNYDDVILVLDNSYNHGRILFIFENDGIEIISDYSISLNAFIESLSFKQLVIDL